MENFKQRLKQIKCFVFDVDGVLTNGSLVITPEGEFLRTMNIKDGYALQLAVKKGYKIVIISGGKSLGVDKRLKGLGVSDVFLGVSHKIPVFQKYIAEQGITPDTIVYVGDDLPDAEIMKLVGLAVCPSDAVDEIKEISHYISSKVGGRGVARDIIEKVLKIQGKWFDEHPDASDGSFSN
jgi:3-deoxy-D-manno-octulosonate 8-phosphate phosphatase (KDO 8-P phosphatase)